MLWCPPPSPLFLCVCFIYLSLSFSFSLSIMLQICPRFNVSKSVLGLMSPNQSYVSKSVPARQHKKQRHRCEYEWRENCMTISAWHAWKLRDKTDFECVKKTFLSAWKLRDKIDLECVKKPFLSAWKLRDKCVTKCAPLRLCLKTMSNIFITHWFWVRDKFGFHAPDFAENLIYHALIFHISTHLISLKTYFITHRV